MVSVDGWMDGPMDSMEIPLLLINTVSASIATAAMSESVPQARDCSQAFGRHARVSDAAPGHDVLLRPFRQENRKQSFCPKPQSQKQLCLETLHASKTSGLCALEASSASQR